MNFSIQLLSLLELINLHMKKMNLSWSITSIYRKGSKQDSKNYRPISLTSQVCRVFERLNMEEMVNYFKINNLLGLSQNGFLKNKSCLTNRLTYMENITKSVDAGRSVDSVYRDFSEPFDKVPHQRLLKKLEALGVCPLIQRWIKTWFSCRK